MWSKCIPSFMCKGRMGFSIIWSLQSIQNKYCILFEGILSALNKRMLEGNSSYVLHYMNMTNKMTNVDHRNILMYIIGSFINDIEKDARKSSLRYSNQVLKKKCCIKRVRASITQKPINKNRSNTFYSMINIFWMI